MTLRMKKFNIFGVYWKIQLLGGGGDLEKPIYRGDCLKKGRFGQFVGLRGVGHGKKEGVVFLKGGWYPNARYDYSVPFVVIENRFTKIKFKYFNGDCDYSSWPGWLIIFLYGLLHKDLAFWKNFLWTSLSFSYSLKITCILLR